MTSISGIPWHPPRWETIASRASSQSAPEESLQSEFETGAFVVGITFIAYKVSQLAIFHFLFIASCASLPMSLLRKACEKTSFMRVIVHACLTLNSSIPYLKIAILVIGIVALRFIPVAGYCIALALGSFQGLVNEIRLRQAL